MRRSVLVDGKSHDVNRHRAVWARWTAVDPLDLAGGIQVRAVDRPAHFEHDAAGLRPLGCAFRAPGKGRSRAAANRRLTRFCVEKCATKGSPWNRWLNMRASCGCCDGVYGASTHRLASTGRLPSVGGEDASGVRQIDHVGGCAEFSLERFSDRSRKVTFKQPV